MPDYCEKISDTIPGARRCEHKGFIPASGLDVCMLHDLPIYEDGDGWMQCCSECVTPHYIEGA